MQMEIVAGTTTAGDPCLSCSEFRVKLKAAESQLVSALQEIEKLKSSIAASSINSNIVENLQAAKESKPMPVIDSIDSSISQSAASSPSPPPEESPLPKEDLKGVAAQGEPAAKKLSGDEERKKKVGGLLQNL